MSKNVTTYECEQGTLLKSYDTFVAFKAKDYMHLVTKKHHSKTTSRHINEFFGGAEEAAKVMKVSQKTMNSVAKFIEKYNSSGENK